VVLRDARGGGTEKVTILHHHIEATNIVSLRDGRERVELANGEYLDVDHVIVTSGHTGNVEPDANAALIPRPYRSIAIPRPSRAAPRSVSRVWDWSRPTS